MKKVIVALGIVLLLLASGQVYAADALYRMLHADEVESFKNDQDTLLVGQLISKDAGVFSVRVLRVVSGEVDDDVIFVVGDFSYGWGEVKPAVDDFCVMSLKRSRDVYHKAWGIFQADSGDYSTLKLVPENMPSFGPIADLACIEWYVNSGGTENDFFFDGGAAYTKAYVKRSNGETVQIYSTLTAEDASETTSVPQDLEATNNAAATETPGSASQNRLTYVAFGAVFVIGGAAAFFIMRRAGRRS